MGLEKRLSLAVKGARDLGPEFAGLLPEKITTDGLSETELKFVELCLDIVEKGGCSRENALAAIKLANAIARARSENGARIRETIGFVFRRNCYSVAVGCLNAAEDAALNNVPELALSKRDDLLRMAGRVRDKKLRELLKLAVDRKPTPSDALKTLSFAYAARSPIFAAGDLSRDTSLTLLIALSALAALVEFGPTKENFSAILSMFIIFLVYRQFRDIIIKR